MITFKPLPRITPNGITVLLGQSTGANISASLSHAIELVKSQPSGSVLYLNTVQDTRSILNSARKQGLDPDGNGLCFVEGDNRKVIYILTVTRGDLYRWRNTIKEYLYMGYIQYVMINSWEFSSKNSRYREEAVYLLKELSEGLEGGYEPVHSLIYAEEPPTETMAQKIKRNGFGKLTGLAQTVHSISVNEQLEDVRNVEEIAGLPEVKEMAQTRIMYHGNEDDPGVTYEEIMRRIAARKPQPTTKEWYENKLKKEEEKKEEEMRKAAEKKMRKQAKKKKKESELAAKTEAVQPAQEIPFDQTTIIEVPVTSIEELRRTPETISTMPIHLNSYSPIKEPVLPPSRTPNLNKIMITK